MRRRVVILLIQNYEVRCKQQSKKDCVKTSADALAGVQGIY